ncbi:MAG: dehalogenase [Dehalococcoidales bacterium]
MIGLIAGAAVLGLVLWLQSKNVAVKWYEWLIGGLGLALLLFTIQNFAGSLAELESTAANMFLLVSGLPAIILLAVSWQLVARRQRSQ